MILGNVSYTHHPFVLANGLIGIGQSYMMLVYSQRFDCLHQMLGLHKIDRNPAPTTSRSRLNDFCSLGLQFKSGKGSYFCGLHPAEGQTEGRSHGVKGIMASRSTKLVIRSIQYQVTHSGALTEVSQQAQIVDILGECGCEVGYGVYRLVTSIIITIISYFI